MRHVLIKKNTVFNVGDEVLINNKWRKITDIKNNYLVCSDKIINKNDLTPKWDLEIHIDSSTSEIEFEISLIQTNNDGTHRNKTTPSVSKIILFNEKSNIYPTKQNLQYMKKIAELLKRFFNNNKISFEERFNEERDD